MEKRYNIIGLLSSSTLKIFACIFMAIDHIGLVIFPDQNIYRIIGRLAFPLFAFFIAEGCKYTRNRLKRFLTVFIIGILLFVFYLVYAQEAYGNIFLTFSVSIIMIYFWQFVKKQVFEGNNLIIRLVTVFSFSLSLVLLYFIFEKVHFEYGFAGMMVPVIVSLFDFSRIRVPEQIRKLDCFYVTFILFSISLIPLSLFGRIGDVQVYCLLSIPFIALYNGKPGNKNLKLAFYIFYPAHIVIIEAIAILIQIISGG